MVNNSNPMWNPNKMKMAQLCNGDNSLPIKIEAWSYDEAGSNKLYGECITCVNQILNETKKFNLTKKQ